jgi:UDP-N-acetylglucosamine 2-epimerase (non-hydrolysing)
VHPRTAARLEELQLADALRGVILTSPLGYIDFLSLTSHARIILTDSGGLQEESTALGIPCLTLRQNTERPVTVSDGTNRVVGTRAEDILRGFDEALHSREVPRMPELWDGHAADRIAGVITGYVFG